MRNNSFETKTKNSSSERRGQEGNARAESLRATSAGLCVIPRHPATSAIPCLSLEPNILLTKHAKYISCLDVELARVLWQKGEHHPTPALLHRRRPESVRVRRVIILLRLDRKLMLWRLERRKRQGGSLESGWRRIVWYWVGRNEGLRCRVDLGMRSCRILLMGNGLVMLLVELMLSIDLQGGRSKLGSRRLDLGEGTIELARRKMRRRGDGALGNCGGRRLDRVNWGNSLGKKR